MAISSPPNLASPTSLALAGNAGRIREVVRLGHPVLRERAQEVPPERFGTRKLRELAFDLVRTMHEASGVGLAAPQIAVPWRVFAYYVPADYGEDVSPRVLVNPVLTPLDERQEEDWEGCLSIPGLRGLVPRYLRVGVKAQNLEGEVVEFEASGFHARVVQHEYDHLDGVVFLDRMPSLASLSFESEWQRFAQKSEA